MVKNIRNRKYKKKRINSTAFQYENFSIKHHHQNPHYFLNQPRNKSPRSVNHEYISLVLTHTLDNLKSNFTKRALNKLPIRLTKTKKNHARYFPFFSKKNQKVFFFKHRTLHSITKKNLRQ